MLNTTAQATSHPRYCKWQAKPKVYIRNKSKTKTRQVAKEQPEGLLEQERKKDYKTFFKNLQNGLGIQTPIAMVSHVSFFLVFTMKVGLDVFIPCFQLTMDIFISFYRFCYQLSKQLQINLIQDGLVVKHPQRRCISQVLIVLRQIMAKYAL